METRWQQVAILSPGSLTLLPLLLPFRLPIIEKQELIERDAGDLLPVPSSVGIWASLASGHPEQEGRPHLKDGARIPPDIELFFMAIEPLTEWMHGDDRHDALPYTLGAALGNSQERHLWVIAPIHRRCQHRDMERAKNFKAKDVFLPDLSYEERWEIGKPYREWFGRQLERAIMDAKMKYSQFAEQLGIAMTQLVKYRKGINCPDVIQLARIAHLLNKPLNYFIHADLRLPGENQFLEFYMRAFQEGKNLVPHTEPNLERRKPMV